MNENKYYTAWIFEGIDPDELHCTHKFLGDLSDYDATKVTELIDSFFASRFAHIQFPRVKFEKRDYFGPQKDVPVLTPKFHVNAEMWPHLRRKLDRYRDDDYPSYLPQVTTELAIVDQPFYAYAFIKNGEILKEWKNVTPSLKTR